MQRTGDAEVEGWRRRDKFRLLRTTSEDGLQDDQLGEAEIRLDVLGLLRLSEDGSTGKSPFSACTTILLDLAGHARRRRKQHYPQREGNAARADLRCPRPGPRPPLQRIALYGESELRSMVSADLLHWEALDIPSLHSHDESHLTYDEERRSFIAAVKRNGPYGRSWHLLTSEDFAGWEEHGLIFHADQTDQENGNARLQRFFDDPAYLTPYP